MEVSLFLDIILFVFLANVVESEENVYHAHLHFSVAAENQREREREKRNLSSSSLWFSHSFAFSSLSILGGKTSRWARMERFVYVEGDDSVDSLYYRFFIRVVCVYIYLAGSAPSFPLAWLLILCKQIRDYFF